MELFSNLAQTTLSAAINNSQTSIGVVSGAVFPSASGTFRIIVDSEIMIVTNVAVNTLTVTRGAESTSAASHLISTTVTGVITAGALDTFRADMNGAGVWASRISAAKAGRMYWPTDGPQIIRDNGASLSYWGPLFPITVPVNASYSWVNEGTTGVSSILDATKGAISLTAAADGGTPSLRIRTKTAPATPYSIIAGILPCVYPATFPSCGIGFRTTIGGSAGKLNTIDFVVGPGTVPQIESNRWTNATTFSATNASFDVKNLPSDIRFLKLTNDGTNTGFHFSPDGINFRQLYTQAKATWFDTGGPDEVFFYALSNSANPCSMTLFSWVEGP